MFEGWENFYLIVGPAAGALIGLMFVVVTLTAGRDTPQAQRGKHLYTSPIVWHLSVVVALSGGAVAPNINAHFFGYATLALALLGLALGCRSTLGIWKHRMTGEDTAFDTWWYGIIPALSYVGLAVAAGATVTDVSWRADGIALALMALLLVSIHAEWDLVTFLAPLAGPGDSDRTGGN